MCTATNTGIPFSLKHSTCSSAFPIPHSPPLSFHTEERGETRLLVANFSSFKEQDRDIWSLLCWSSPPASLLSPHPGPSGVMICTLVSSSHILVWKYSSLWRGYKHGAIETSSAITAGELTTCILIDFLESSLFDLFPYLPCRSCDMSLLNYLACIS